MLRFMMLGSNINKKYQNTSLLLTEQVKSMAPPLLSQACDTESTPPLDFTDHLCCCIPNTTIQC